MTMIGHMGHRVIVVEDEAMVLLLLQDMLTELGCELVGTAARLEPALRLAAGTDFGVAILDVNLCGKRIDPVADVIAKRGLPIVFVTGYGVAFPADQWSGQVLSKPYEIDGLPRALEAAASVTARRPNEPLARQ